MATPRSALIVVDMQEDFCPPNGSLAVPEGRDIAPIINRLLSLPFSAKVASQDWHPPDHISFDDQHSDQNLKAFESSVDVTNPDKESETGKVAIWPVHCIQDTPGAAIIPEINASKLDLIVKKGQDKRTEMYSAFGDMFTRNGPGVVSHVLDDWLRKNSIECCFVVGLTGDCCVKATALDAKKYGYDTYVIGDATRSVEDSGWKAAEKEFAQAGVIVIQSNDSLLNELEA